MKQSDRLLGMDRDITRRDILHGVAALTVGAVLPGTAFAGALTAPAGGAPYPPALTGLRGSHAGSFEVAHALAREGREDWGPVEEPDSGTYDLVVVGAGLSGLAAAHFYRKEKPGARILILDNHDDFGGHAKRNEFTVGDRTLLGYGGAQTLEDPSDYKESVKTLLTDMGIDLNRFDTAFDHDFYTRNGLRAGVHFDQENWGVDRTVAMDWNILNWYIPLANPTVSFAEGVAELPISDAAKSEFLHLLTMTEDQIPEHTGRAKWQYLMTISYRELLAKHLGITEPEVFALLQNLATDFGVGIEAVSALAVFSYSGLPGREAAGLPPRVPRDEPYIHHFPDGNASVARLLVRSMIPAAAPGNTMEDIVTARFDYLKLDQAETPVRLRLNSTVIDVQHVGDPQSAEEVSVTYVRDGQAYRVRAQRSILACYNAIIPALAPTLPDAQKEALANQVKQPILYTNVALRNWQAWHRLGLGGVFSPSGYHTLSMLDFPVSLGDYSFSGSPDEPIILHMERFPHVNNEGLTPKEQFRAARHELMATSFETIERHVRSQLVSMLGDAGFDPATDIVGLTVNRWAHGYAYGYDSLHDTYYEDRDDPRYPHVRARKAFGRISIANSDAAAGASFGSAVSQGYRAAMEQVTV